MRPHSASSRSRLLLLAMPLVLVIGCGGASASASNASGASTATSAAPDSVSSVAASVVATDTFPKGPVPGNKVSAPLPADAPPVVKGLAPLPSCGGQILFEPDPDISPLPTPPMQPTSPEANRQASDCLDWAWENGKPAQLAVSAISDEQDEIYTLYRLPGDGTVDLLTRVKSHPDQVVTWTDATCKQLSLQGDAITPAECSSETPLN